MIRSFKCKDTKKLFNDYRVSRFQAFETVARRKLKMLDDSTSLNDLAALPENRLEVLRGDRRSQHNIRINDQYRINVDLALRLATYFGTSAQFWMNLQTSYDLRVAKRLSGTKVKKEIQPVRQEQVA